MGLAGDLITEVVLITGAPSSLSPTVYTTLYSQQFSSEPQMVLLLCIFCKIHVDLQIKVLLIVYYGKLVQQALRSINWPCMESFLQETNLYNYFV